MIVIPAVDIKDGKCVRLLQGRMEDETVYGDFPWEMALRWQNEGAAFLHIVDLNGAFEGHGVNDNAVRDIVGKVDMFTELGGGIRDMARIDTLLGMGIDRVILGTAAIENPSLVSTAIDKHGPEKIVVGIDAKSGIAATRGWATDGGVPAVELGREMKKRGVGRIVYTDIARDGMLTGPNIDETVHMAKETNLKIIASGGISNLDDIVHLQKHEKDGICSVITGKALYENAFKLKDAVEIALNRKDIESLSKEIEPIYKAYKKLINSFEQLNKQNTQYQKSFTKLLKKYESIIRLMYTYDIEHTQIWNEHIPLINKSMVDSKTTLLNNFIKCNNLLYNNSLSNTLNKTKFLMQTIEAFKENTDLHKIS